MSQHHFSSECPSEREGVHFGGMEWRVGLPVQGRKGRTQDWAGEPQRAAWVRGHLGWRSSVWEPDGLASALCGAHSLAGGRPQRAWLLLSSSSPAEGAVAGDWPSARHTPGSCPASAFPKGELSGTDPPPSRTDRAEPSAKRIGLALHSVFLKSRIL